MKRLASLLTLFLLLLGSISLVSAETYTQTFTKEDRTYITTKTIEGTKVTIETKIYDSSGNLIKTEVVVKTLEPTPVKEKVYPTKTITKTPTITKIIEKTPTPKPESEVSKPTVTTYLETDLPLGVSSESGNLVVKTPLGDRELSATPDSVVKHAQTQGLDIVSEVKLIQAENEYQYQISGTKKERFLALAEVYLPTAFVYSAENGGLEKVEQSTLVKVADLLSF